MRSPVNNKSMSDIMGKDTMRTDESGWKKPVTYYPIGVIHTPFSSVEGMPIQPSGGKEILGQVEVFPPFCGGLKDLEGFSRIILLYHCNRAKEYSLEEKAFLDNRYHGVFATRAPKRPNPVGLSIVQLIRVKGCVLEVQGIDILDQTPILDIKPYVPEFDAYPTEKIGWLTTVIHRLETTRSDDRFVMEK
jgi:tRNA-Thr(GGU) m(6)t(6)A37 methyltransferase TsaA